MNKFAWGCIFGFFTAVVMHSAGVLLTIKEVMG